MRVCWGGWLVLVTQACKQLGQDRGRVWEAQGKAIGSARGAGHRGNAGVKGRNRCRGAGKLGNAVSR